MPVVATLQSRQGLGPGARGPRVVCEHPNPIASFFFWNRTRRDIALYSFGMFSHETTVFAPYLDHAVFDFLFSRPGEMLVDKQFHVDTISHAFPAAAGIAYARSEGDPQAERWPVGRRRLHFIVLALDLATYFTRDRPRGAEGSGTLPSSTGVLSCRGWHAWRWTRTTGESGSTWKLCCA